MPIQSIVNRIPVPRSTLLSLCGVGLCVLSNQPERILMYRLLEIGEKTIDGDEVYSLSEFEWRPAIQGIVMGGKHAPHRRKLPQDFNIGDSSIPAEWYDRIMSREEAELVAGEIVMSLYHQMDAEFRVMLQRAIIEHLSPKEFGEWDHSIDRDIGDCWRANGYLIIVDESGQFHAELNDYSIGQFSTLDAAKAAANSHWLSGKSEKTVDSAGKQG